MFHWFLNAPLRKVYKNFQKVADLKQFWISFQFIQGKFPKYYLISLLLK